MISTRHVDELTEERRFVQAFYLSAPRLPSFPFWEEASRQKAQVEAGVKAQQNE